jgi:formiminotetrahydrofolate cyclodeaminase
MIVCMPESLTELSCLQFSEQLASKAPVPGGGGAAALTGALAAGLGCMAANLTVGKKKYLPYEEDHIRIIARSNELRQQFLELVDEDAAAFEPLSAAYSMDKNNPESAKILRTATLAASGAPLKMMQCCAELVTLLEELLGKCSVLMLSDVGCAALAVHAALEAASMNVFVNTRTLPGDTEAESLEAQASGLLREFLPRSQAVSDAVMRHLRTWKNSAPTSPST